uniref:Uncharacterized protein n=1 Tax=Leptobrachium leishanense TaxID=445787 RepID=A0A8C5M0J7_9ANUR
MSGSLGKGSPAPGPARLVLLAKGIKHEVVNINLMNKPDCYFEKNPLDLVLIVCDYLDEAYPKKRLTPSDPLQEAKQRIILELSSGVVSEQYKVLMAKKSNEGATATILILEENPCLICPWFERFPRNFYFINLSKWYEHMLQDTAAKQTLIEPEVMLGFFKLYSQDSTEVVDYGL